MFALSKASPVRNRLEVLSGVLGLAAPVTLTPDLYIEGSDTIVTGPNDMFTIAPGVSITLSHLRIQPTSGLVATVGTGRGLRLFDVQTTGGISVVGGTLDVDRSVFTGGDGITCMAGTLTAQRSHFDHSAVGGTTCQLIVRRSRFDMSGDGGFGANGGVVTFENNLIIQSEGIADSTALVTVAPASVVRFNTFVNTAALASDGLAMSCDSTIQVSSNIFAYGSMHPLSASCRARYSLFDSVAVTSVTAGVGNKTADGGAIFADKPAKDFHLSPSSPARGAAESGLPITDDFDGNPRPSPAGAAPDIGAFEAH